MKKLLLGSVATLMFVVAGPAAAATKTVSIKSGGFSPASVSIVADDTVTWKNNDTKNHQVVASSGTFASPVLRPGASYSFRFTEAGNYNYRDALYPSHTGVVKVAGPPPAVTIAVSEPQIDWGTSITIAGAVNNKKANEQVTLTSQPYGQASPIVLATVVTGAGGTFSFTTRPQLLTVYQATWKTAKSLAVTTAVRPVISFGRSTVFITRVYAGRSMAGKSVQLQRLSAFGQWVTLKQVQLDASSRAGFRVLLPRGTSRLRIAMSVNQAGVGYLAGFSREITFRRP
jgi:plastocyanin